MSMSAIEEQIVEMLLKEQVIGPVDLETTFEILEAIQRDYVIVELPRPDSNQMDPPHDLGFSTPDFKVRAKRGRVLMRSAPEIMMSGTAGQLASALLGAADAARGQK